MPIEPDRPRPLHHPLRRARRKQGRKTKAKGSRARARALVEAPAVTRGGVGRKLRGQSARAGSLCARRPIVSGSPSAISADPGRARPSARAGCCRLGTKAGARESPARSGRKLQFMSQAAFQRIEMFSFGYMCQNKCVTRAPPRFRLGSRGGQGVNAWVVGDFGAEVAPVLWASCGCRGSCCYGRSPRSEVGDRSGARLEMSARLS